MGSSETAAAGKHERGGHGFGTMPVFLAGISTILGAIMFLRFGYAVGHVGLIGALGIILIGHLVTIPTALALAEIATNRKVEGGGEYYIISRSFGTTIGSAIGISLYLSQAISVAFYMIAFAEAFLPVAPWIEDVLGMAYDPRMVSLPATVALVALMLKKGADMGVKVLYVVVATLVLSLILFFLGSPVADPIPDFLVAFVPPEAIGMPTAPAGSLTATVSDPDTFFYVFAIVFPAFTGMTAGVGLSGDLANPRRSIPLGTIAATVVGMFTYVLIVWKLHSSASPELLADTDSLVMADIALWGPIIPIGLAAATLSSAIGSLLVAPRTLQALGADAIFPGKAINRFLWGTGDANEPGNATVLTAILALGVVMAGNVDFVAKLISMFFMVTYGALCAISFLEHFAANPSYRPSFRSRWYVSLFGAAMCFVMMILMDPVYALLAILFMIGVYRMVRATRRHSDDLAKIFVGVMTQAMRYMQVRLQLSRTRLGGSGWRPSIISVNGRTFDRVAPVKMLGWLSHRYGFGTYLHHMEGSVDLEHWRQAEAERKRLLEKVYDPRSSLYLDVIVSPSLSGTLAQTLQAPGISGVENNTVMFEFAASDPPEVLEEVREHALFVGMTNKNIVVLRHGMHHFGEHRTIHIWLTWHDFGNANLMILFSYIMMAHPDWKAAEINIFAALPPEQVANRRKELKAMIDEGRIPVSEKNIRILSANSGEAWRSQLQRFSADADLTILGMTLPRLREKGIELFEAHDVLNDVLFVAAQESILIE